MADPQKGKREPIDWDAIEKEYRIGQKSLRTLAAEHKTTAGAISKRSKKYQWYQDKSKEVREKTRAALLNIAFQETVEGNRTGNIPTPEAINIAVRTNVEVVRGHRTHIANGIRMVDLLSGQLDEAARNRDEIVDAIDTETGEDRNTTRRNMMLRAVALPAHSGVMRDLSVALKNLIPLERQAFNLDDPGADPQAVLKIIYDDPRKKAMDGD